MSNGQSIQALNDGSGLVNIVDARNEPILRGIHPEYAAEMVPYLKGPIAFKLGQGNQEWSDTPVGYRAASRAAKALPRDNRQMCRPCMGEGVIADRGNPMAPRCTGCNGTGRTWPPLRLAFRYTVERVVYQTRETYAHGNETRHCGTHFRVAVIQWSLRLQDEE